MSIAVRRSVIGRRIDANGIADYYRRVKPSRGQVVSLSAIRSYERKYNPKNRGFHPISYSAVTKAHHYKEAAKEHQKAAVMHEKAAAAAPVKRTRRKRVRVH